MNMSIFDHTLNQSHQYASFNCRKIHTFVYLVCVECFNINHNGCISQIKEKFTLFGGHKINCCKQETPIAESNDSSILEQIVHELAEEKVQKDYFLSKLKKGKELLIYDALDMEANLNQDMENQKQTISKLRESINKLVKKRTMESISTSPS